MQIWVYRARSQAVGDEVGIDYQGHGTSLSPLAGPRRGHRPTWARGAGAEYCLPGREGGRGLQVVAGLAARRAVGDLVRAKPRVASAPAV